MSRVRIPPNPLRYRFFQVDSFKKIGDRKRVNPYGSVATEMPTTVEGTTTDPWALYIYGIKAPATKAKYSQRLRTFLEFSGYNDPNTALEDKARAFAAKTKADNVYAFNCLLKFFRWQRERIDRKEIAIGTVRNYAKAIKPFYEMADINVAWHKIMRGLPRGRRYAEDRAPTVVEIRRMTEYTDRRIRPIVYTMASSGIRVRAWDYLQWGHITPIERDGKLVSARMLVYAGTQDTYVTCMSAEAYRENERWMRF